MTAPAELPEDMDTYDDVDERRVVATLRLPIPLAGLEGLADVLESLYGLHLSLSQSGDFLIVRRSD